MGIRGIHRNWCVGGNAKGEAKEKKKRKVGGHSRPRERQLLANRVKHCMIHAPVMGVSGQEGKRMERWEAQHKGS